MNQLIDLAEGGSSELMIAQAHTTRRLLQDLVLDMIATTYPNP
ncbi:hypothetical protein ACFWF7_24580 [Nocardia sp. NPDC060256]